MRWRRRVRVCAHIHHVAPARIPAALWDASQPLSSRKYATDYIGKQPNAVSVLPNQYTRPSFESGQCTGRATPRDGLIHSRVANASRA